jgi:hypothetical protein
MIALVISLQDKVRKEERGRRSMRPVLDEYEKVLDYDRLAAEVERLREIIREAIAVANDCNIGGDVDYGGLMYWLDKAAESEGESL